jgi:hypothetical protein
MKKQMIVIVLFVLSVSAFAQEWSFGAKLGMGSYSMSDLKNFQRYRLRQTDLPLKTTENYPISPVYSLEVGIREILYLDKIGIFYTFSSTGSRSTVSDYSGRIDFDAIVNGNQLGLSFLKNMLENYHFSVGTYVEASYLFSLLKVKDYLAITSPTKLTEKETYRFNSNGAGAELGMAATYRLPPFSLQLNVGYLHDIPGKLYLDGTKDQWLAVEHSEIKPAWSGFRMGLQVAYIIKPKSKIQNKIQYAGRQKMER